MAENYFVEGLKVIGQNVGGFCVQNRAHIFTAFGVAGTITTGYLSARSGARAARKIDKRERELGRALTFREKARLCGKDFIAPTVAGTLAVVGTVGSDVINTKIIGERTALLIASEKAYEKLSEKTKEVLGEKKARQVEDEIAKEKVKDEAIVNPENLNNAPRCGNGDLHPFVDGYSNLLFWSNLDYINCCVKDLQEMMRDLNPRGDSFDYSDKIVGVPYSEWLRMMGFDPKIWNSDERRTCGWNKGYGEDGEDDDPIGYFTTTTEWKPGFAVTIISWEKNPTDMRLGRLMKSNEL